MMRTETVIDTVALQYNFDSEEKCDNAIEDIRERLEKYKYIVNDNCIVEYNYKTIATIDRGSFSYVKKGTMKATSVWYLSIKLAGLKTYIPWRDIVSHNCFLLVISYFNTRQLPFKVTQCDVALNIFTKYENVLSLCTTRHSTTQYYKANEEQLFDTTTYIEKFKSKKHKKDAVSHVCCYDKSNKEKLPYNLVRHEVSMQKKFFKSNGFDIGAIFKECNRYHVMYIPNKKRRQEIMDQYDSYDVLRQRDIKALKLDRYRLFIDLKVVVDFALELYNVNDSVLDQYLLEVV